MGDSLRDACFTRQDDTPRPGVVFYSMRPLLEDATLRRLVTERLVACVGDVKPTHVCGIETRGIFVGMWLADALSLPFVSIRKLAQARRLVKSDADLVVSEAYKTEYEDDGSRLCVERGALPCHANVVVCDDVLATGGSLRAARSAVAQTGANVVASLVLIDVLTTKTLDDRDLVSCHVRVAMD